MVCFSEGGAAVGFPIVVFRNFKSNSSLRCGCGCGCGAITIDFSVVAATDTDSGVVVRIGNGRNRIDTSCSFIANGTRSTTCSGS